MAPSVTPSPTTRPEPPPQTVVRAFYAAINSGNYAEAWRLSLGRFGGSYSAFVAGFQDTDHDVLTITGVSGSAVRVSLLAYQSDGTVRHYTGTYEVSNGRITAGQLQLEPTPQSAAPPLGETCGAPTNPWGYNFCGTGGFIGSPPDGFCDYFDCIANFPNGSGYVEQCRDGEFSRSGGQPGACSDHDGERRPLNTP